MHEGPGPETAMEGVRLSRLVVTAMVNGEDGAAADAILEADRAVLEAALGSAAGLVVGMLHATARSSGRQPADLWAELAGRSWQRFGG